jgi:hypothetical protein
MAARCFSMAARMSSAAEGTAAGAAEGTAGGAAVEGTAGGGTVWAAATEATRTHIHLIGVLIGWKRTEL